jgi:hypothetical protein
MAPVRVGWEALSSLILSFALLNIPHFRAVCARVSFEVLNVPANEPFVEAEFTVLFEVIWNHASADCDVC